MYALAFLRIYIYAPELVSASKNDKYLDPTGADPGFLDIKGRGFVLLMPTKLFHFHRIFKNEGQGVERTP